MNLVRWFRKNNKKVMAVVVIVIMFGFIGGGTLLEQFSRRATGLHKTIAYFGDNKKITNSDLYIQAQRELDILRSLRADVLLSNQDLHGILLGELLFAEQRTSPALVKHIKQTIRTYQYRISDKQINDMYPPRRTLPSSIYWILLTNEAQLAGLRVPNEQAGIVLGKIIPDIFGQTYSQRIGILINQHGIPEQQLLTIFSKLLAVWQYAQTICSSENVTSSQITQIIARQQESVDAELVEFDSAVFAPSIENPASSIEQEHFDKYKKFFAGAVSEENPYGFGYKLPDRVQLEYIVVRLDDVRTLITPPTNQEKEDYYDRYRTQLFTEQIPSDPNDPNSPLTQRTKSYAEVTDTISDQILKNKINSKANEILQEAKTLTESGLQDINDTELANLSTEQLVKIVGDYKTTAEQLSEKHNIKIYAGQTGLLSPIDMQTNEYIARLYLEGYGQNPVSLARIVFAVDDLAASELGPFDVSKPRIYENIGPLKDFWGSAWSGRQDVSGQIMAIVRVIKAIKATEPQSIDQTFSTSPLEFDPNQEDEAENVYSVKEKVTEDLKKLAAMETAKNKAEEFIGLAAKDGWDSAIDKFNELYGQQTSQDPNDPNISEVSNADKSVAEPFKLQNLIGLQRISSNTLETLIMQSEGNPGQRSFVREVQKWLSVNEAKIERQFIDQLYSLVPQDSNTVDALPLVMEFKPGMSVYCIKNISVKRISQQEYEENKAMQLQREDYIQSGTLSIVHFNPQNILKRMNFRPAKADGEPPGANTPAEDANSSSESEATS